MFMSVLYNQLVFSSKKDSVCRSDHFPIMFDIKTNFKIKSMPKRKTR